MKAPDLHIVFAHAIALAVASCSTGKSDPVSSDDGGVPIDGGAAVQDGGGKKDADPNDPCSTQPYTPNPPDTCGDFLRYPCGLPANLDIRPGCFLGLNDCAALCPDVHYSCRVMDAWCDADAGKVLPDDGGGVVIDCSICKGSAGRRPRGLADRASLGRASSVAGAWLARTAYLEAASVHAFRQVGAELVRHGAPERLVLGCEDAARDEVRHARVVSRLARRFGGRYAKPRVEPSRSRPLSELATDNAVEGCMRETFAALVATWQATHATDPEVARAFRTIAADETRHAELSWAIAEWTGATLDEATIADVSRELAEGAEEGAPELGLPDAATRRLLARSLARDLFPRLARVAA